MINSYIIYNKGFNVVIDKSAIATIATAKAFEESKGFVGTFSSACRKYYNMLKQLNEEGIIEFDGFLLLTANFDEIRKRNIPRNHILEGIWLEEMIDLHTHTTYSDGTWDVKTLLKNAK